MMLINFINNIGMVAENAGLVDKVKKVDIKLSTFLIVICIIGGMVLLIKIYLISFLF